MSKDLKLKIGPCVDLSIKGDQRFPGWRIGSSTRTLKISDIPRKKIENKKPEISGKEIRSLKKKTREEEE